MSHILIVDDRPLNRGFLVTLFGYYGHTVVEASDGIEALQHVDARCPDLMITDLLMPNMDGEELAQRLHASPATKDIPIIFYTATYRAREARQIADRVGVRQVLAKPSEPAVIMAAVADALGVATATVPFLERAGLGHPDGNIRRSDLLAHNQNINDQLQTIRCLSLQLTELLDRVTEISDQQAQLLAAVRARQAQSFVAVCSLEQALQDMQCFGLRLTRIIELGLDLASERNPVALTDLFCRGLQDIFSARYVGVVILGPGGAPCQFSARGLDAITLASVAADIADCPAARRVLEERHCTRAIFTADTGNLSGLPPAHPRLKSLLTCPLIARGEAIGWMYVADRLGNGGFTDDDECISPELGAQLATTWESLALYNELDRRVAERTAQLQAASQAKSLFLSSMSHELRTPLNAILGFAQLLEVDIKDSPQCLESIGHIQKAGWHLLELIDEVLDLTKIETGALRLSMESIELREIIAEILQLIDPAARKQGVSIVAETAPVDTSCVLADRTRLRQVLLNLLINAVKYNRVGGSVIISAKHCDNGRIRIEVADTGSGLTPIQLEHLFEAFNRLGRESEDIEGSGIGLVITKRLIEAMGGAIGVLSTLGEGSIFWVELAVTTKVEAAHQDHRPVAPPTRPCKLLYVEDNPVNMMLVAKIVATQPHLIMLSANTGAEGIELARTQHPDIILLDIGLPDMSGLEVLQHLQLDERTRATPVLALSAHAEPQSIKQALEAGFHHYITKPIRVKDFLAVVYQFIPK